MAEIGELYVPPAERRRGVATALVEAAAAWAARPGLHRLQGRGRPRRRAPPRRGAPSSRRPWLRRRVPQGPRAIARVPPRCERRGGRRDQAPGPPREEGFSKDADKLIRRLSLVAFLLSRPGRPATAVEIRRARRRLRADERRRLQAALLRRPRRARRSGHRRSSATPKPRARPRSTRCRRRPTTCRPSRSRPTSSRPWPPACSCSNIASPTASRCAWRCSASPTAAPSCSPPPRRRRSACCPNARRGAPRAALPKLQQAVAAGKTVSFVYYSIGRDEELLRTVDPYGLLLVGDEWYLIAWCHLRARDPHLPPVAAALAGDLRHARPARLLATGRLHPRRLPRPARLAARRAGGPRHRARGRRHGVVGRGALLALRHDHAATTTGVLAREPRPHRRPYNSGQQLVAWVLSMGEAAELLEPPELRERLGAQLQQARRPSRRPSARRRTGRSNCSPAATSPARARRLGPATRAPRTRVARPRQPLARAAPPRRRPLSASLRATPTGRSKPTASPALRPS